MSDFPNLEQQLQTILSNIYVGGNFSTGNIIQIFIQVGNSDQILKTLDFSQVEPKIFWDRYQILDILNANNDRKTFLTKDINYKDKKYIKKRIIEQVQNKASCCQVSLERQGEILHKLGKITNRIPEFCRSFEKDGYYNLIYEHIDGIPLTQEFNSNVYRKTESEVIALLKEILDILDCMQQCNIIHCNIVSDNLIRRAQDGRLCLINFESANYIHNVEELSFADDLYDVGKICIQLLTGVDHNEYKRNNFDWRKQAKVSRHFANILDQMVSKDILQRCSSAQEIRKSL